MSLTKKKKNRRDPGGVFPVTLRNEFFSKGPYLPNLLDLGLEGWDESFSVPPVNITERDKEYLLELSAPGLKKEDFKIAVESGTLNISSEKEEEKEEEDKHYRRHEFSYNSFSRSFPLPENAEEEGIHAKYENGMLRLTVPKKEMTVSKARKQIKVA